METFFIVMHQSHKSENGYNMTLGGDANGGWWKGKKRSPETIAKITATKLASGVVPTWLYTPEAIAKRVTSRKTNGNYTPRLGQKNTPETIEKMRLSALCRDNTGYAGWKQSDEAKRKIAESNARRYAEKNSARREEAKQLRSQGLPFSKIAKQLGISMSTAYFWGNGTTDNRS